MTNLVDGMVSNNGDDPDVFRRDMDLKFGNHTILVSSLDEINTGTVGSINPSISGDGSRVVFEPAFPFEPDPDGGGPLPSPDDNGTFDIYMNQAGIAGLVFISRTNGNSSAGGSHGSINPAISSDGLHVVFRSESNNFSPGDTSEDGDIYMRDLSLADPTTILLTPQSFGNIPVDDPDLPAVSGDGRFVVFQSGSETRVTGDTNGLKDIFLHDLSRGTTVRVSISTFGGEINTGDNQSAGISPDGRFIVWKSPASDVVDNDLNSRSDVFRRGPMPINF